MKIVIDMNLTPLWVDVLKAHGLEAIHWSTVGDPRAEDTEILNWALANDHVVSRTIWISEPFLPQLKQMPQV